MRHINNCVISGNLGRDPEMRYTPNGKAVTGFSIAHNWGEKNPATGEWTNHTNWWRVTLFDKQAEDAAAHLVKGDEVVVMGRLVRREYEAKDGTKHESCEIRNVMWFRKMTGRGSTGESNDTTDGDAIGGQVSDIDPTDLPF